MKSRSLLSVLLIALVGLMAVFVAALPEGPTTLSVLNSTRRTATGTSSISALAGNVSLLNIEGTVVTQSWFGVYGNVTGTVSLENSKGDIMFDWTIANPQGEIYATEAAGVPQFGSPGSTGNITCWNYTKGATDAEPNYVYLGEVEGWNAIDGTDDPFTFSVANIKQNAVDSINNTFSRLTGASREFPTFYVGDQVINGTLNVDECPSLALYNSTNASTYGGGEYVASQGAAEGGSYQEVILFDDSNKYLIYTAIIDYERSIPGFDGNIWDFQMIVHEDGHFTDTAVTPYNFYVELE